tara:strand:- start:4762 stop:4887 length:126 start_codon:yes stop_codon:yes gene_type:complete
MKDDYEPLDTHPPILGVGEEDWGFIGDDQGLDYLGSEFTGA